MRRALVFVLLVAGGAALAGATTGGPDTNAYVLRAQFDNGSGLRTGMDVRVSGIEIGRVRSIELDQREPTLPRALAVIDVTNPAGMDFRSDGRCSIRSATLLGDRYVDCTLGKSEAPLRDRFLPVAQTGSPVDPDLMFDVFRLPVRQRLSILINELGTGLAGNGPALNEAIRRANPAFLQLDRTLEVLRTQRKALARLAESSDRVLAPLAAERERLAGFVVHGNELFESVATRRDALRATFRRMPAFLRELRPTLGELRGLAGQAGPALGDLDAAATQLSDATAALEPTAREGTRGLRAFGRSAPAQASGLNHARPLLRELARLTPASRPVWTDFQSLLGSLRESGGIERLTELPMAVGLTSNGYDRHGYYARANAVITTCTSYAIRRTPTCVGTFPKGGGSSGTAAAAALDYLLGNDG